MRGRPPKLDPIASGAVIEIIRKKLAGDETQPSYRELAEQNQVSLATMTRMVKKVRAQAAP